MVEGVGGGEDGDVFWGEGEEEGGTGWGALRGGNVGLPVGEGCCVAYFPFHYHMRMRTSLVFLIIECSKQLHPEVENSLVHGGSNSTLLPFSLAESRPEASKLSTQR